MRYIKGYPAEIHIDGAGITLHDINKMILSVFDDKTISEEERLQLYTTYRTERQRFLDKIYDMTAEKKNHFLQLEQRLAREISSCAQRLERMRAHEEQRAKKGLEHATSIEYHLEVADCDPDAFHSREEVDLQDTLFAENRLDIAWGIDQEQVLCCAEEVENLSHSQHIDEASLPYLNHLRDTYLVAWQDIEKIARFMLTIYYRY